MTPPLLDVVIAVHAASRPIGRAVESVLGGSPSGRSRALVVAHGIDPSVLSDQLDRLRGPRVRVEAFSDGVHSPAGPFNHGLAVSDAEFVTVMGSDDALEPGALDAALDRAERDGADAVILPLRHQSGPRIETPLVRLLRTTRLSPVRDRMFSRTAPLALMRRGVLQRLGPLYDPELVTGGDMEFSARLWVHVATSYHRQDPAYIVGADAVDRITLASVDLTKVLAASLALAGKDWVRGTRYEVRRALAVKVLRVHVLGGLLRRCEDARPLSDRELTVASEVVRWWLHLAPGALSPFSRADRGVLEACRDAVGEPRLRGAVQRRKTASRCGTLLPRNPLRVFDRESTVRRYVAYFVYSLSDHSSRKELS